MLEASPLLHYNRRHGGQILTRVVRLHQERDAIPIVGRAKRAPHWGVQSRFRVIYVIVIPWLRGIIVDNCPDSRGRSPSERAVSVR